MDIYKALLSATSSQGKALTKPLAELSSLSLLAFAQEVCSRIKYEIKVLPKEHGQYTPRGILQGNLTGFHARLMVLGDALSYDDTKNILNALGMLEKLCQVSYSMFEVTFIPASRVFLVQFILEAPVYLSMRIQGDRF